MAHEPPPNDSPATMKTIAKLAGVSPITVSRALRGDPRHSTETRERIQRIAKELGYRTNPLVAALMSTRARKGNSSSNPNLAVLNLGPAPQDVRNEPSEFGNDLYERAVDQGYSIETFTYDPPRLTADRLRRILINRGVRGIILMPAPRAPFEFHFNFDGFAAVAVGHSIVNDRLPRVTSHPYLRTLDAIQRLADRGYTRIALVNTPDFDRRFHYRMSAAASISRIAVHPRVRVYRHMLNLKVDYMVLHREERERLAEWTVQNKIQVIVSNLRHVYDGLLYAGLKVPEDVAYVHLDRHDMPDVACMDQMLGLVGRKAVDLVIAMINRNEFTLPEYPSVSVTPSVWRDGRTAPPLTIG